MTEAIAEDSDSYYAALNLRRDATEAEIKKSYRQLAQLYHPDKHTDPVLKTRAEASFTRLQEAYEVSIKIHLASVHQNCSGILGLATTSVLLSAGLLCHCLLFCISVRPVRAMQQLHKGISFLPELPLCESLLLQG